jgi:hypothetical protein
MRFSRRSTADIPYAELLMVPARGHAVARERPCTPDRVGVQVLIISRNIRGPWPFVMRCAKQQRLIVERPAECSPSNREAHGVSGFKMRLTRRKYHPLRAFRALWAPDDNFDRQAIHLQPAIVVGGSMATLVFGRASMLAALSANPGVQPRDPRIFSGQCPTSRRGEASEPCSAPRFPRTEYP